MRNEKKPVQDSKKSYKAIRFSACELAARGKDALPEALRSDCHLIYSSPATLAYNSPGAQGFGVKRAGLAVPGSVMLLVSPGCCGRNTSLISRMPEYEHRFFYLLMDETDLITGRHLKKIPQAVSEVVEGLNPPPSVVMICITCVDALLGTDMERICRRAEELVHLPVRPCYMYALTREGHNPPMVHVRQSLYSLLKPLPRRRTSVNLLGFFSPLIDSCELYSFLKQAGVRRIREISTCPDYAAFLQMAEANFCLVLHPEARFAAGDLQERLGIPYIELRRLYDPEQIHRQYQALAAALGIQFKEDPWFEPAKERIRAFRRRHGAQTIALGECMNADPFELAVLLLKEGFEVLEIYGTITDENFIYVKQLSAIKPDLQIYSNPEPTMLYYDNSKCPVDLSIGKDAGYYHPESLNLPWNEDVQPFGYTGVMALFDALEKLYTDQTAAGGAAAQPTTVSETDAQCTAANKAAANKAAANESTADGAAAYGAAADGAAADGAAASGPADITMAASKTAVSGAGTPGIDISEVASSGADTSGAVPEGRPAHLAFTFSSQEHRQPLRGFKKRLSPFAPDQSGAVSVLYALGGIIVICDAGGCTGNVCGFDEPRWFEQKSAIFSAGLRDMDAILGRDDRLTAKLAAAARDLDAEFAAYVGTPVPAVIGTDFPALKRMTEKKTGLPVITVDTAGFSLYDEGIEKATLALLKCFAAESLPIIKDRVNILGMTPLDFGPMESIQNMENLLKQEGWNTVSCLGINGRLDDIRTASSAAENIVVSPGGLRAAQYLEKRFHTPWRCLDPLACRLLPKDLDCTGRKVLVLDQQIRANSLREELERRGANVHVGTWFMQFSELARPGDYHFTEEEQLRDILERENFDILIGDQAFWNIQEPTASIILDLPHYAVSGSR